MPKLSIIVYVELQKCYLLFKILLIPIVRNQIWSSGEIVSVGNFTRDSDQILQRHDFVENDPSPSQSEIALVLHEITKTRECMNAVFDHLDDLCDRLGAFCEKRERDHRMNKDVAISKSTPPTCSFMESMESDYRPLRVNGQHGWQKTVCFHFKAHGHFSCECPNLSAPSGADMNFNRRHSMKSRNRHGSVNDKQRAGIDLNSMIRQNLRDFDLNSMIKRNLCDFVNDMDNFNRTWLCPEMPISIIWVVNKMIWYLILMMIMISHGLTLIQMNWLKLCKMFLMFVSRLHLQTMR